MQYVNDSCRVVYVYEMFFCFVFLEEVKILFLVFDFFIVEELNKFSVIYINLGKCNGFFDNDIEVL